MADPLAAHRANVTASLNLLVAARDAGVKRFIYASSSAVYGDDPELAKVEHKVGKPLSPYAATKAMNELYAGVFGSVYGLPGIGLRYFNVFGPRQDPEGAYAAVIPKWIAAMLKGQRVSINGDGATSRDFCYVDNVVQANLLAATTANPASINQSYNIGLGENTTLNELFQMIAEVLRRRDPSLTIQPPFHGEFRPGDVRHSLADITKAQRLLAYAPAYRLRQGLEIAMDWYYKHLA